MKATADPEIPPQTPPLMGSEDQKSSFHHHQNFRYTTARGISIMSDTSHLPCSEEAGLRQRRPLIVPKASCLIDPSSGISCSNTDPQVLSSQIRVTVTGQSERSNTLTQEEKIALLQSPAMRKVVTGSLKRATTCNPKSLKPRFRELIFTKKFTVFDGQNESAANSPFIGFFNLFWMGIFLYMLKIVMANVYHHGNMLGTHEIFSIMISRDLVVLGLSDGIMCALMSVSWCIQRAVLVGYLDWNGWGWILQHVWQTLMLTAVVGLTLYRDWPWTHVVFFVLHGLTMLMKHHSYAFYNGYLSSIYKERATLQDYLEDLNKIEPSSSVLNSAPTANAINTEYLKENPQDLPRDDNITTRREHLDKSAQDHKLGAISQAISSGELLDLKLIETYKRVIQWEIDVLSSELRGRASTHAKTYPNNLTISNCAEWIVLPTLVYELEYPRSNKINWQYVAVKLTAVFGIILVMILISQHFIYPVLKYGSDLKASGASLSERFWAWPGMLSDLMFPFMIEYLLTWYLIWETILNLLAELTYFDDRSFYDTWWNTVTWDQFARDWNRPVHNFLLRHVYHSSQASMKFNRFSATLLTFLLSACVHELVMWCLFKKLRGYLLMMQMTQVPLLSFSRSRFMKDHRTLGNLLFWLGLFTGPSLLCSLYIIM